VGCASHFHFVIFSVVELPALKRLTLQPLTDALLSEALNLDQQCFGGLWTDAGYRREMASPNSELLIFLAASEASEAPNVVALGCYWAILEEAHITIVAVDPAHRRGGLGQAMVWVLLNSAHRRGLERATLEVRVSNESAIALYSKFGFQIAGQRKRYYQDNGEDALILWRGGLPKPEYQHELANQWEQTRDRLIAKNWHIDPTTFEPFISALD